MTSDERIICKSSVVYEHASGSLWELDLRERERESVANRKILEFPKAAFRAII